MTRILKRPSNGEGLFRLPARDTTASPIGSSVDEAAAEACEAAPVAAVLPEAELEALREQARKEGWALGRQAAAQELRTALDQHAQRWRQGLENAEDAIGACLEHMEQAAVAIAFEAVATVLGNAYAEQAGLVELVRQLTEQAAGAQELTVHVAADQRDIVSAALEREPRWQHRKLRFEVDPSLGAGGCRVSCERGVFETDLALQLQGIQDALLAAHRRQRKAAS